MLLYMIVVTIDGATCRDLVIIARHSRTYKSSTLTSCPGPRTLVSLSAFERNFCCAKICVHGDLSTTLVTLMMNSLCHSQIPVRIQFFIGIRLHWHWHSQLPVRVCNFPFALPLPLEIALAFDLAFVEEVLIVVPLSALPRLPEGALCGIVPEGAVAIRPRPYKEKPTRSPSYGQSEVCWCKTLQEPRLLPVA